MKISNQNSANIKLQWLISVYKGKKKKEKDWKYERNLQICFIYFLSITKLFSFKYFCQMPRLFNTNFGWKSF